MTGPTRRFWQIHLSTALVLMLVASVFLGVNLFQQIDSTSFDEIQQQMLSYDYKLRSGDYRPHVFSRSSRGVPFCYFSSVVNEDGLEYPDQFHNYNYLGMAANVGVLSITLVAMAIAIERAISRREAHKP